MHCAEPVWHRPLLCDPANADDACKTYIQVQLEGKTRKDHTSPLNVIWERANWLEQSPKPSSAPHGYQLEAKLDMTCT